MDHSTNQALETLTQLVSAASKIVVFSGAGISTESGIPDFRGPGGVWEKFDPADFHIDRFLANEESRRKYWHRSTGFYATIAEARPNAAHHAIVALEKAGKLAAVITQNVDGLHQLAGTTPEMVVELHGSHRQVKCLRCEYAVPREEFQALVSPQGQAPDCRECGGLMKPATISFGQMLRAEDIARATRETGRCDLFLVIGSSLVVYPAAQFPLMAVERGAKLAIINLQETPHDAFATVTLREKSGIVLPRVLEAIAPTPTPLN